MSAPREQLLCHLDELPEEGSARGFDLAGQGRATVFAVRHGGALHVYVDSCPHHDTPLPWRRDAYLSAAGDHIVCAAHGALFDIRSGRCVLGPCLGEHLQPVRWREAEGQLLCLLDQPALPFQDHPPDTQP
jgi:nitrite reductase/ring-hydroxylating ferredoxin subunit